MIKILLIEDEVLIQRMYSRLFELENFQVSIAENGQLGLAAASSFKPDIILLDLIMPVMDGMQVLMALKSNTATKEIPVIVLTNLYNSDMRDKACSSGAETCLIKSQTSPRTVVSTIKQILDKHAHAIPTPQSNTPPKPDQSIETI